MQPPVPVPTVPTQKHRFALLSPSGTIAETVPRGEMTGYGTLTQAGAASGTAMVMAVELYAGQVVSALTVYTGSTAQATTTHAWAALCDSNMKVLAVSPDNTTWAPVAGSNATASATTFTFGSSYTVPADGVYYAVFNFTGTTVGTYVGSSPNNTSIIGMSPAICGTSSTGLTTPPAVGTSLAAVTPVATAYYWRLT